MKREDIYIEVTPDTIGAYVAVLEKHGEPIGNCSTTESYKYLTVMPGNYWFVYDESDDVNGTAFWTPEHLDQWLTERKAAEREDAHAEPSERTRRTERTGVCVLLHRLHDDAYASVRLCPDYVVVERHDGRMVFVNKADLFEVGNLTPLGS